MSVGDQAKECSVCHGTRVGKANPQNIGDFRNGEKLDYEPIECQHCKGTGIEPN